MKTFQPLLLLLTIVCFVACEPKEPVHKVTDIDKMENYTDMMYRQMFMSKNEVVADLETSGFKVSSSENYIIGYKGKASIDYEYSSSDENCQAYKCLWLHQFNADMPIILQWFTTQEPYNQNWDQWFGWADTRQGRKDIAHFASEDREQFMKEVLTMPGANDDFWGHTNGVKYMENDSLLFDFNCVAKWVYLHDEDTVLTLNTIVSTEYRRDAGAFADYHKRYDREFEK